MKYHDLRDFLALLHEQKELHEINTPISPYLEITEICDRTLRKQGPALLFKNVSGSSIPLLGNLFGTKERIALAMGQTSLEGLREVGRLLAFLKQPQPPQGFKDLVAKIPLLKQVLTMQPKIVRTAVCQRQGMEGHEVNLGKFPIQTCWPEDVAPLITWGLVTTKSPLKERANLGIYRQQVMAPNKIIMRWLKHRGGALDYAAWCKQNPEAPFPIAVTIGADPATLLAAVTPIPDTLSEYAFAALLRGSKTELVKCISHDLYVPASAEIVLEGFIYPNDTAMEGPFGDHTGYYNEVESFPVMTIERICHRPDPIYHSTYTGRPPDEPAMLGLALNEVLLPILQQQFPEIVDFYLPAEGCSYRLAIVTINKQYPGHAQRILLGVWSYLTQFMYTKFIIVCDADVDARKWEDVIWALTTRVDPERDTLILNHSPIDYLDFASPTSGLGSKMGIDATHKWAGETTREWGREIHMKEAVKTRIDLLWNELAIPLR